MWKNVIIRCTTAIQLKPRYIKAIIRRYKANEALDKTHEALLGNKNIINDKKIIIVYFCYYLLS